MLRSHKFGAMMKYGISLQSSLTVVRIHCAGMLCCLNLNWFSAFNFIKNVKYFGRKFILACVFAKTYQNTTWFDKFIAKIKWWSFLTHVVQSQYHA